MAEGVCAKCSRYLLIIFNFLFWISGCTLLGIGIWLRVDTDTGVATLLGNFDISLPLEWFYTFAYILIAVGAFIFITGFCGCCGAIRESAWMLAMYIGCVVIVLIAELVGGIYIAVERSNLEGMLEQSLATQVRNYSFSGNVTEIDYIQIQFDCCGSRNYSEYKGAVREVNGTIINDEMIVPESCCKGKVTPTAYLIRSEVLTCQNEARTNEPDPKQLRNQGCYDILEDFIYDNLTIIIGVVIGIAVVEILGVIFAIILCQNRTEYWDWD